MKTSRFTPEQIVMALRQAESGTPVADPRGTFVIPDVEKESWSHPVIAHGRLFLREQNNLFCYDKRSDVPSD